MKKSEFKKLVKPIIKECVNEVLLEEGTLSSVISEVIKGLKTQPIVEQKQPKKTMKIDTKLINEEIERREIKIQKSRQKMLDAIGESTMNGVDLFEGTTPLGRGGSEGDGSTPQSPLAGTDPNDPGVDISSLMGKAKLWKTIATGGKK